MPLEASESPAGPQRLIDRAIHHKHKQSAAGVKANGARVWTVGRPAVRSGPCTEGRSQQVRTRSCRIRATSRTGPDARETRAVGSPPSRPALSDLNALLQAREDRQGSATKPNGEGVELADSEHQRALSARSTNPISQLAVLVE